MRRGLLIASLSLALMSPRNEQIDPSGFTKLSTTAYHCGTTTASGTPVEPGIVATDKAHRGMVAEIYLVNEDGGLGSFLGYYRCEDAGGTDAIRNGYVIDVYRANYTQCVSYMKLTRGKVWVRYVEGKG